MGHKTLLGVVAISAVTTTVLITAFASIANGRFTAPWTVS